MSITPCKNNIPSHSAICQCKSTEEDYWSKEYREGYEFGQNETELGFHGNIPMKASQQYQAGYCAATKQPTPW